MINLGEATPIRETDAALLVELELDGNEYWVPKSVIHDDSEVYAVNTDGDRIVQLWWARKQGLTDD